MSKSNTARSGNIAIRQEYDAALKENTLAALELFIARHPNSEWTDGAKKKLIQLKKRQ
jgi:outer membrane protein assembly factor BamD (BamD/ComL family)